MLRPLLSIPEPHGPVRLWIPARSTTSLSHAVTVSTIRLPHVHSDAPYTDKQEIHASIIETDSCAAETCKPPTSIEEGKRPDSHPLLIHVGHVERHCRDRKAGKRP